MQKTTLKSILHKRKPTAGMLAQLAESLGVSYSIQDVEGRWLVGEQAEGSSNKYEVVHKEIVRGWVYGEPKVEALANLLSFLFTKEVEKKRMGAEVLDLYHEINLIYTFSEKLASALDAEMIAKTALEEVSNMIEASGGAVIFFPEQEDSLRILSQKGEPILKAEELTKEEIWTKLLGNDQAGILNEVDVLLGGQEIHALLYAPLKVKHRLLGMIILFNEKPTEYRAAHLKLLTTLALQSAAAIESSLLFEKRIREAQEREEAMRRIHEVTTRFVPYEFISALGREKLTEVMLGDQVLREVTVFFSDIRDYTSLAEQMEPEENFRFVNAFHGRMGPIIYEHHGFVNQYLGDGIMAIFPKKPGDALRAAIHMQQALRAYNEERSKTDRTPIKVGMGLHTGPLIMGIIGDVKRLEAATIADTVNTASRIESLTKHYGGSILLSEECMAGISDKDAFSLRYLGKVQVKGKRDPVDIFECFDGESPKMIELKSQTLEDFEKGLVHFYAQNFAQSVSFFEQVLKMNPHDEAARLFLGKAKVYTTKGVSEEWTGVEKMMFK